jgi:hypothetical protein
VIKKMKLKILDRTGHTEQVLRAEDALEAIHERPRGDWVFVDGQYIALGEVTAERLDDAAEVVVTPALQAG